MALASQNNKDRANVNTTGIQFSNKEGFDPSALVVGYWNDMLSLKIHPALPKEKQTEKSVFDYEHVVMTSLTVEKLQALHTAVMDRILPAIEAGEEKNVSVIINMDSLVTIGTGVALNKKVSPYVAIHKGLDPETRKPESSIYYEFKSAPIIEDYDVESGKYETTFDKFTEFKAFLSCIAFAIPVLMNVTSHVSRTVDRAYKEKLTNEIASIAAKLGVSTSSKGGYTSKKDVFNVSSSSTPHISAPTPSDHAETIQDLGNFMDD